MGSIPLPALAVNPPPNPLDQYSKVLQLQALTQENRQRQLALSDQQAASDAMHEWDGKDINDLPSLLLKHGGSANAVFGMKNQILGYQKNLQEMTKDQLANEATKNDVIAGHIQTVMDQPEEQQPQAFETSKQDLVKRGYMTPEAAQGLQYQGPAQLAAAQKFFMSHTQQVEAALKTAEAGKAGQEAARAKVQTALDQIKLNLSQNSKPGDFDAQIDTIAPKATNASLNLRTKSMVNFALGRGDIESANAAIKQASEQIGAIEKETNPAVQAGKIQVAVAEAKAKQMMEGLTKPGYAFDPATGTTKLTDQTSYLQSGGKLQAFRPVNETEVKNDTMLINRLGDVHQKIAEYEKALQKPVDAKDQGNMAALLGTQGLKVGAFGTEIPMDRVNAALNKENLAGLSANARDQIIAYKNAREAMLGYKTVLSGSARGSDKSMDLLTQALPDPAITDSDYSNRALSAFKQNLHIVGQGLPELPGIKSPRQIEQDVWGNKTAKSPMAPGQFDWNAMPQHQ